MQKTHRARLFAWPLLVMTLMFWGTSAAHAFYWHNWPGSGNSSSSSQGTTGGSQTQSSGNEQTPPGGGTTGNTPGGNPGVPEPSTLLAGLIGLGAIGVVRRVRRS
jgi:hypothetical protein